MNDEVLKAEDISKALKGILTDSMHLSIDVTRQFRTQAKRITGAKMIQGSRDELIEVQKLFVADAKGLKVKRSEWVQETVRRLDDLINALPEEPRNKTVFPAVVRIP